MIRSFRHKGLDALFVEDSAHGIPTFHRARLERMLDRLDASEQPRDMDVPGWRFHPLKGDPSGRYAVWVSGHLRLTFAFEDGDAIEVDLEDYH